MTSKSPLLSAIILNFRSHRDTVRCAKALQAQTISDQIEILVTDNHSVDESIGFIRAQLQEKPGIRIIENRKNIGYGCGNNAAIALAKGEYILIINPDNILPPAALEQMITFLQKNPDVGIVGPALVYPDGTIRPSARPFPRLQDLLRKRLFPMRWHRAFEKEHQGMMQKERVDVDWIVGACLLMKTSFWKEIGGYDPQYFLFFEDIDLCRRVHAAGKKVVFLPQILVLDQRKRLSGNSMLSLLTKKTTRIHLYSACRYFWKWGILQPKTA